MGFLPPLRPRYWQNEDRMLRASKVMGNDGRKRKIKLSTGKASSSLADNDFAVQFVLLHGDN